MKTLGVGEREGGRGGQKKRKGGCSETEGQGEAHLLAHGLRTTHVAGVNIEKLRLELESHQPRLQALVGQLRAEGAAQGAECGPQLRLLRGGTEGALARDAFLLLRVVRLLAQSERLCVAVEEQQLTLAD